jgi:hypothetical protein
LLPAGDPRIQADALIRATLGYVVVPGSLLDLDDPAVVDAAARQALVPILTHPGLPVTTTEREQP